MFKDRLKQKREEKKLSQAQLAELVCIRQQMVAGYECGIKKPTVEVLSAIASVLDVTTDWLLGRE